MKIADNIYKAYFYAQKDCLYYNEIKEISKLSDSSLSRSLKELTKSKVLSKLKTKSNTYYKILDKKYFSLEFSKIAYENFKNLNAGVKIPLKNFLKNVPLDVFTIILFGSSSIKEEKDGSDIDILVVSDKKLEFDKIKNDVNITSNYPLSIFQCDIEELIHAKDSLVLQAKKTGFPIYKEQNFYEVN